MSYSRSVFVSCALALVGCIATRSEDAQGSAHFIAPAVASPADYAPLTAAPGVGGANAGAVPDAGPQQPSPSRPGGAGMSAQIAMGAGAPSRAGAPAATSGGAGAAARGATGTAAAGSVAAAMAGSAAPPTAGNAGMLTVDFKTVNQGGTYAPQNVGAVWIETSSGMFVKTLERWGSTRANHLTRWNMASGGWGSIFGGGNTADQMDAVSRATLRSHGAHHVTWDMQDPSGKVVPDGSYKLVIEVTEDNFRAGASGEVAFEKGPMPLTVTAPDKAPFAALMLAYQP